MRRLEVVRRTAVLLALTAATLVGQAVPGRGEGKPLRAPRTLLTVAGHVSAFAQDGSRLAWVRDPSSGPIASRIELFDVPRKTRTVIGTVSEDEAALNPGLSVFGFALAGTQVLLANQPEGVCGNTGCNFVMLTTSLETRRLREVGTNSIYRTRDGLARRPSTIPVAGDGRTLVYYAECPSFDDCGVRGQAIRRVSGSNDVKVIDSSHPTGLAAADGRIAVAVRLSSSRTQVSIREAASGELVTTFVVSGAVKGLSLSPRRIAVLVARRTPNQRVQRVEVRDARNGKLAKSVAVPVSTAPAISIAGAEVVFRAGRTIHALDTATGRVSVAAKAAAIPIGLSIEGNRVGWAENLRVEGRSVARIRTLSLAASRGS